MDIQTKMMLQMVAQFAASALQLGLDGYEFADRICERVGGQTYDEFIKQHPKETIIPLMQSIPEAWGLLQAYEPRIPQFLDEFYDFANGESDDETTDTEIAVPADPEPEVARRKKGGKKK